MVCLRSWEHVRASPSPSPPPPATTTTAANPDTVSGIGMFNKATEQLRTLQPHLGSRIEQLATSHKDFQKHNSTPNQRRRW